MKVFIASDHAGFQLKATLVAYLRDTLSADVEDLGAHALEPGDDYPDLIRPCAERVAETAGALGIVIGGSGQGEAIAANRVPGVRAAVYYGGGHDIIRLAREHNDANVLSLGARFVTEEDAQEAVRLFLETPFTGEERHVRRIAKL